MIKFHSTVGKFYGNSIFRKRINGVSSNVFFKIFRIIFRFGCRRRCKIRASWEIYLRTILSQYNLRFAPQCGITRWCSLMLLSWGLRWPNGYSDFPCGILALLLILKQNIEMRQCSMNSILFTLHTVTTNNLHNTSKYVMQIYNQNMVKSDIRTFWQNIGSFPVFR